MILDFDRIAETAIPRMKGGEGTVTASVFDDGSVKILRGILPPGASIGMHRHEDSCEVIQILKGSAKVLLEGGEERLTPGLCHYCPKGTAHSLVNDTEQDVLFLGIVPKQ